MTDTQLRRRLRHPRRPVLARGPLMADGPGSINHMHADEIGRAT